MALVLERKVEKPLGEHYHTAASVSTFIRRVKRRNRADRYIPELWAGMQFTMHFYTCCPVIWLQKVNKHPGQVQQFCLTEAGNRF